MVFWAGILVAAMFAFFCIKRGLYDTWAFVFNTITAIYLAVFAEPQISQAIPTAGETPLGDMLVVAGIAIAVFFILQGISYTFVTGYFSVPFPKALDVSGAGLLGFLIGVVIWNFGIFLVCSTPVFPNDFAAKINYDREVQQSNIAVFSIPCNMVNMIVSADDNFTTQQAVDNLLAKVEKKKELKTSPKIIKPREPTEPNKPEQKREMIGPPPELESQGG